MILGIRDEVTEPYIFMGFQHPPGREDFRRMIEDQDTEAILACFEKIPVKPGDVFIVPGGMPHAIGEGVFMIEVMEPTDFAVRIEFERGGYVLPEESRFMNRGIDFALSMFSFETSPVELVREKYFCDPRELDKQNQSTEYALIGKQQTSCFSVNRIEVRDRFVRESDSFYIGIVSKGYGTIIVEEQIFPLEEGTKFFIPYQTGPVVFKSEDKMEIIVSFPPVV